MIFLVLSYIKIEIIKNKRMELPQEIVDEILSYGDPVVAQKMECSPSNQVSS